MTAQKTLRPTTGICAVGDFYLVCPVPMIKSTKVYNANEMQPAELSA